MGRRVASSALKRPQALSRSLPGPNSFFVHPPRAHLTSSHPNPQASSSRSPPHKGGGQRASLKTEFEPLDPPQAPTGEILGNPVDERISVGMLLFQCRGLSGDPSATLLRLAEVLLPRSHHVAPLKLITAHAAWASEGQPIAPPPSVTPSPPQSVEPPGGPSPHRGPAGGEWAPGGRSAPQCAEASSLSPGAEGRAREGGEGRGEV